MASPNATIACFNVGVAGTGVGISAGAGAVTGICAVATLTIAILKNSPKTHKTNANRRILLRVVKTGSVPRPYVHRDYRGFRVPLVGAFHREAASGFYIHF